MLIPPLLASTAETTASSLRAVMTAPWTSPGIEGSGSVTRNFSASSVAIIRLDRISSGFPTRGRRWGFALTMAAKVASSAAIGDERLHCERSALLPATGTCTGSGSSGRGTSRCAKGLSRSRSRPEPACRDKVSAAPRSSFRGTCSLAAESLNSRAASASMAGLAGSGRLCARFVPSP